MRDLTGNLPSQPKTYPDQRGPIVRSGERKLVMAQWGMLFPPMHFRMLPRSVV